MNPDKIIKEELLATLTGLRWSLLSLRYGGIADWPHMAGLETMPAKGPSHIGQPATEHENSVDGEKVLSSIQRDLGDCTRCRLHRTRTRIVFGEGSVGASIVFVGEGPGFEEDQQGRPFVGRAGKLLDKMIRALGLAREQVYICNMVKCRPPDNRTPNSDEIEVCSPFLVKQIEAIRPQVICALGACSAQNLLHSTSPISRLRGKIHHWRGIPLVATFHPAYLLRNPAQKSAAWHDLVELLRIVSG
ncbi:MAG: uracil-DNA glycosylase [Desulforhabdus sp.]|jgi:DNA polymerase|nr:uracil-DNA glycosylase [Desulforhabdus sp.]